MLRHIGAGILTVVGCLGIGSDARVGAANNVADKASDEAAKFTPLFDGKTFDGWEGNLDWFRIEDGAIVAGSLDKKIARNEFLCTKKEYGNFELKVKFKIIGKYCNAGIQFRSERIPNHHEVKGYQADVGKGFWGCLYDESRRNTLLVQADQEQVLKIAKLEDWNEYVIRCEGPHIQLWINGEKTADYTEKDEKIPQKGIIGVQIHFGRASEAWYKDIEIREL